MARTVLNGKRPWGSSTGWGQAMRAGRVVAPMFKAAAKLGYDAYKTGSRNRAIRDSTPPAITTQRDYSVRYVRKRMPARKRKRWVGFTRKVNHVALQQQPLQVYQDMTKLNPFVTTGVQGSFGYMLLDTNCTLQGHLTSVFKSAYGGAGAVNEYLNRRIFIKSAAIDIQVLNNASTSAIMDVYECYARKDVDTTISIGVFFEACVAEMTAVGTVIADSPVLTPFDVPNFCKHYKVAKKTEYLLGGGQLVTLQKRQAKNMMVQGRSMPYAEGCRRGTFAFLIQYRGVPNATTLDESGLTGANLCVSTQTTVHFAIPPGNTAESIDQTK